MVNTVNISTVEKRFRMVGPLGRVALRSILTKHGALLFEAQTDKKCMSYFDLDLINAKEAEIIAECTAWKHQQALQPSKASVEHTNGRYKKRVAEDVAEALKLLRAIVRAFDVKVEE